MQAAARSGDGRAAFAIVPAPAPICAGIGDQPGIAFLPQSYSNNVFRRYDLISSEPSYPTESVVANLFTQEYFEIAASKLAPEGIYCQWLPYHMLTNRDVTMMVKTFATVFPHAMLWKVPDGLDLIRRFIPEAFARLRPGGWLALEIGHDQADKVQKLLDAAGFIDTRIKSDLSGIERFPAARKPS